MNQPVNQNMLYVQWVALQTIAAKEIRRFMRIWTQTLLPPAITMTLYFVIFGQLIGKRVGQMDGFDYMAFIVPGLIMMSVITSSYANVSSSFFSNKFQNSVEEMMVAPVHPLTMLLGYIAGGVARGLAVGLIVTLVSLYFTDLKIHNLGLVILVTLLSAIVFSLGGFVNALLARTFDDVAIVPTFVITPLTYLGGVFYSISLLPGFWQKVSMANPILYMVNTFRYGILGISDINIYYGLGMLVVFITLLTSISLWLLKHGKGMRK